MVRFMTWAEMAQNLLDNAEKPGQWPGLDATSNYGETILEGVEAHELNEAAIAQAIQAEFYHRVIENPGYPWSHVDMQPITWKDEMVAVLRIDLHYR